MQLPKPFLQESFRLHRRRVCIILSVYLVVVALFTLLDASLLPDHGAQLLGYRAIAGTVLILLLTANALAKTGRWAWVIGFTGYLWCGLTVLLSMQMQDKLLSPYYVSLLVVITVYTALAPLNVLQTLLSGALLIGAYALVTLLGEPLTSPQAITLFTHLFFITSFVLISAIQGGSDTVARLMEYRLRQAEKEAADRLSQQAGSLEKEAHHRASQQRISEQRYRILYEALPDDLVLVNSQGRLLQASSSYLNRFHGGQLPASASLFDVVAEQDWDRVRTELLEPLDLGQAVASWTLILRPPHTEPMEVEISGALLQQGDRKLGLQLVLRDTGIRKKLEQDLFLSLRNMRQMENAAILALAKLSEYRDVTPGNHLERIREYCRQLATDLSNQPGYATLVTPVFIQNLYQGAILHDIGKVAVPDEILCSQTPLDEHETALLRQHTIRGGDIIREMEQEAKGTSFLSLARNIAYFHHERWDGQGYPDGLRGEQIPLEARILRLADAYEELTVPLNPAQRLTHAQAVSAIASDSGAEFDPALVAAFLRNQDAFDEIHLRLPEPQSTTPENMVLLPAEFQNRT